MRAVLLRNNFKKPGISVGGELGTTQEVYNKETFVGGEMLNGKRMRQGDFKAVAVAAPYGAGDGSFSM